MFAWLSQQWWWPLEMCGPTVDRKANKLVFFLLKKSFDIHDFQVFYFSHKLRMCWSSLWHFLSACITQRKWLRVVCILLISCPMYLIFIFFIRRLNTWRFPGFQIIYFKQFTSLSINQVLRHFWYAGKLCDYAAQYKLLVDKNSPSYTGKNVN